MPQDARVASPVYQQRAQRARADKPPSRSGPLGAVAKARVADTNSRKAMAEKIPRRGRLGGWQLRHRVLQARHRLRRAAEAGAGAAQHRHHRPRHRPRQGPRRTGDGAVPARAVAGAAGDHVPRPEPPHAGGDGELRGALRRDRGALRRTPAHAELAAGPERADQDRRSAGDAGAHLGRSRAPAPRQAGMRTPLGSRGRRWLPCSCAAKRLRWAATPASATATPCGKGCRWR